MSRSFEEKLASFKLQVSRYLERFVQQERPSSLYEPIVCTMQGGGKKLRPALLLLANECLGGTAERALPAAAAVEILHNFTLVHDDIMDDDATRRGRPTVHSRWDTDVALLAGDGLVALAYRSLLETKTPHLVEISRLFTDGIVELCEGQALDREFETRSDVSMQEYLEMIVKKTGRLLSMCAQIGGILAGAGPKAITALRTYGECLGTAFQIQDDLLDLTADEALLGKDFASDLKQRKKTYLIVHALQHGDSGQKKHLAGILQNGEIGSAEIRTVRHLFEGTGTIAATKQTVEAHIARARCCLDELGQSFQIQYLHDFLQLILKRKN